MKFRSPIPNNSGTWKPSPSQQFMLDLHKKIKNHLSTPDAKHINSWHEDDIAKMKKESSDEEPLLPHQQRVIDRLSQPEQTGLVVYHNTGAGKTRSAIESYKNLNIPMEVIHPASLEHNFKKEIHKWVSKKPNDVSYLSQQNIARNGIAPEAVKDKLMVVDEAHRLRNENSKGYQALKQVAPLAKKRLLLSGSPLYDSPSDVAKLINLAAADEVMPDNKDSFNQRYVSENKIYPSLFHQIAGVNPGIEKTIKNKEELKRIFHKYVDYHDNSKDDYPEIKEETIDVPMSEKQQQLYKTIMHQLPWALRLKVSAGLPPDKKELNKLLPFLSGARTISNSTAGYTTDESSIESPKIDKAFEYFREHSKNDPNYKAVIYSNFLENGVNEYKKRLDSEHIPYGEYTGDIKDNVRNQMVKDYNANKLKALLISSAGSEGLDTKGTRLMQVLEPHWNLQKIRQVIGRTARYKSHENLPKDQRNVLVQHYLSSITPSIVDKIRNKKPVSSDQYLQNLSDQKEQLNQAFIDLIKN